MEKNLGAKIDYEDFIKELDVRLKGYFDSFGDYIHCKRGCSECCERGDYPLTDVELAYLMQGYAALEPDIKTKVQDNIKNMVKGAVCPFLINSECSVYSHRPVICRVHGLSYFYREKRVKVPYCVENGKNFTGAFEGEKFNIQPLNVNLDTYHVLEGFYNEMRDMYDWFHSDADKSDD